LRDLARNLLLEQCQLFPPCAFAPARIDQLAMGRRRDPGGRLVGNAALDPITQRGGKGLLHRFLGAVERAASPDPSPDGPATLAAKPPFDRRANFSDL